MCACVVLALPAIGQAVILTPNQLGRTGTIPGTYDQVDFVMSDGNWASPVTLPASARSGATIRVRSSAAWAASVSLAQTNLSQLGALVIRTGDSLSFEYEAATHRWTVKLPELAAGTSRGRIPETAQRFAQYSAQDEDFARGLVLPPTAADGALMVLRSAATKFGWASGNHLLYAGSLGMAPGDFYAFTFRADLGKWYLSASDALEIDAKRSLSDGWLARVIRPNTRVRIAAGDSVSLTLPATAGDRDRVTVISESDAVSTIRNDNVDFTGTMQSARGDVYDFMWVGEKNKWVVLNSPRRQQQTVSGSMGLPVMTSPSMALTVTDQNFVPEVSLPTRAKPGDKVVLSNASNRNVQVVPRQSATGFTSETVIPAEVVAFKVDNAGKWQRDTYRIDVLSVYSEGVAAQLGEQAAQLRQIESFRLTNEALDNSNANFRIRMAGMIKVPNVSTTLSKALGMVTTHTAIQAKRNEVRADGVYYEGTEEGCGLAYVGPGASAMAASGSLNCGTTVMRHEFGHNMGLNHNDTDGGVTLYARGYGVIADVMGGNAIPYYSTPKLYESNMGIPMGIENSIDSVRAMNERSLSTSRYR